ncbi:MAG TPA: acylphosphatase [Actinobacteria bacterium]|nr:acylphosphatase [Actinomycetota bacterium]
MTAVDGLVGGRVQGVGFRWFAKRVADELGVAGWVRNLPDGRVAFHAEGPDDQVAAFVARLRRGPAAATVTEVSVVPAEPEGTGGFSIRY